MTISAVNKYPLASAKSEREREIENCAYSRTAVTKSVTKTIAFRDGKNALSCRQGPAGEWSHGSKCDERNLRRRRLLTKFAVL